MSKKRFICGLGFPINSDDPIRIISDGIENKDYYKFSDICNVLNEQESIITSLKERNKQLRRRLEKINGGYGHLTHRNGLTANEWVIESQEKELKKKNEQISDWIEQHSKDIVKIGEQQTTIRELKEEMVRLHKMSIELMDRVIPNLRRENEKLRKTINEVIELLVEEVDLFSDKATEHDIIAYKEMNEFDNKDAYYMCISTKKAIKMLQRCL